MNQNSTSNSTSNKNILGEYIQIRWQKNVGEFVHFNVFERQKASKV